MIEADGAVEAQFVRPPGEPRDRDAVAEHVVDPAQIRPARGAMSSLASISLWS